MIALIAVLLALLGPVFGQAKNRSFGADEISRLHQLGVAAQMYEDQSNTWPLGVPPLVEAGLVPRSLVVSHFDQTKQGWANELVDYFKPSSNLYKNLDTTYRRSYIGPYDYAKTQDWFQTEVLGTTGAGWLVSLNETTAEPAAMKFIFPKGNYTRLLNSGSVVRKVHRYSQSSLGRGWHMSSLFTDEDKDDVKD